MGGGGLKIEHEKLKATVNTAHGSIARKRVQEGILHQGCLA